MARMIASALLGALLLGGCSESEGLAWPNWENSPSLRGTVIDQYGAPVSGVVFGLMHSTQQFDWGPVTSDGNGRFEIQPRGVASGEYNLNIRTLPVGYALPTTQPNPITFVWWDGQSNVTLPRYRDITITLTKEAIEPGQ